VVDQSLIDSVKKGKQQAFKELYECCIRYVYSIVGRYVSNKSDHQDVIQEIFARIFMHIDSFDESKGDFKYWLRRLTINVCYQHHNKKKRQIQVEPIEKEAEMLSIRKEKATELSRAEILKCLNKMPSGYKDIFMMVVIDEFTHKEVSETLNISHETSRSQLHRAKKWLRENKSINELTLLAIGA